MAVTAARWPCAETVEFERHGNSRVPYGSTECIFLGYRCCVKLSLCVLPCWQYIVKWSVQQGCACPALLLLQVWQLVQQQGGKVPSCQLAPLLHLYKARLALACHNYKAAKKEVCEGISLTAAVSAAAGCA